MKAILLLSTFLPFIMEAQASLVIGDETGPHSQIDANFIQARNGGNVEDLIFNLTGGSVRIGSLGGFIRYSAEAEATGIGATEPQARLHIAGNTDASLTSNGLVMIGNGTSSMNIIIDANEIMARNNGVGSTLFLNRDGGNVEFFGNSNGDFIVHDLPTGDRADLQYETSTGKFFIDNSSRRYKENITRLEDDWSKILQVRPVSYTRPGNPGRWEYGYVAEEIDSIGLTTMVGYDASGIPEDVRYDKMILYLVEIVKIQQQEINELKDQIKPGRRKVRSRSLADK